MAMTSDERSEYPLCGAKKKNGEQCRAFAGQGTDHRGIGRCKYHGGSTASHRAAATKEEAKRVVTMGEPIEVAPGQALQAMLNLSAGALAWLKAMVANLDPKELERPEVRALIAMYNDERDRMTRVAKVCSDSGLGERQMQLAEHQTEMIGDFLERVMAHVGLTKEQRKLLGPAIRAELPALNAGSFEAEANEPEPVLA